MHDFTKHLVDDMENQRSMMLAREVDPERRRTIGPYPNPSLNRAGYLDFSLYSCRRSHEARYPHQGRDKFSREVETGFERQGV